MMVKELMEKLAQIDPNEDILIMDNEYGPTRIYSVGQVHHHITTANGKELPRMVWVIQ